MFREWIEMVGVGHLATKHPVSEQKLYNAMPSNVYFLSMYCVCVRLLIL